MLCCYYAALTCCPDYRCNNCCCKGYCIELCHPTLDNEYSNKVAYSSPYVARFGKIVNVYDGDTVTFCFISNKATYSTPNSIDDSGTARIKIRLARIDTPEMKDNPEEATRARDYLAELLGGGFETVTVDIPNRKGKKPISQEAYVTPVHENTYDNELIRQAMEAASASTPHVPSFDVVTNKKKRKSTTRTKTIEKFIGGDIVMVDDLKAGKYVNRVVAEIYTSDGRNVSDLMLESGLAHPYNGGTKNAELPAGFA